MEDCIPAQDLPSNKNVCSEFSLMRVSIHYHIDQDPVYHGRLVHKNTALEISMFYNHFGIVCSF